MIALEAGQHFLRQYAEHRIAIVPHPDADGLAGAAILWRTHTGEKDIFVPEKGWPIYSESFRYRLREYHPAALILVDQGSRTEDLLPGIPTLTIDHHVPHGIPRGVFVTSYPHRPGESASHLCYLLAGEPEDYLWLGALGDIGDYGAKAPFSIVQEAKTRYTHTALLETVALINAARRSSRFDWHTAFQVVLQAENPRQIANHERNGVSQLIADREEVLRELARARKSRPFFADPWAVIPFSSPCLVHGLVASSWLNRLKEHYVIAANFGYRLGYVHFSIRSALHVDLVTLLREIAPAEISGEWGHGHPGATGGAITRQDFLLLLTHMGYTPEQVIEIDRAAFHMR